MTAQPEYFIVAGPNGAGKSVNGHLFVPDSVSIFNGDLVLADVIKQYPHIEVDRLHGAVAKALEDAIKISLAARKNFAWESNYAADLATVTTLQFKNAGYRTNLIYFGLDDLTIARARVINRTRAGGHNVSAQTLQDNFKEGVERLPKDLHLFDNILFIDTRDQNVRIIAHVQKELGLQFNITEQIPWYDEYFKKHVEALQIAEKKQVQQIRQSPRHRRGFRM